jgi:ABC-type phosphate transport system substrate-binding protein
MWKRSSRFRINVNYVPEKNPASKKFIGFELSEAGQQLVKEAGYFPINEFHKQINKIRM